VNYLAHFHLAAVVAETSEHPEHQLLVGALLGDFVKGPLRGEWQNGLEAGIALHRRIDALTDTHPEVIALLEQLPADYRRYGGIMLDVCFDYCLSRQWRNFSTQPLPDFTGQVYATLADSNEILPPKAKQQAQRLQRYDVLGSMHHWQTVSNMLARIGLRLQRSNPLEHSAEILADNLPAIEQHFMRLYPELMDTVRRG